MTESFPKSAAPTDSTRLDETLDRTRAALMRPMGAKGVYARTRLYEGVQDAMAAAITALGPTDVELLRFPPVMSRAQIHTSGYPHSFSHLLGCVACLGEEETATAAVPTMIDAGQDWSNAYRVDDLVLTPASCYPVYPIAAARGPVAKAGWTFDVGCDCFRREPSDDLDRLQSFRMREYVCMGTPDQVLNFREAWIAKGLTLAADLGLPARVEVASDPFLGPGSDFLVASQRGQCLKFELLIPVISHAAHTACMSFNYHKDHFGAGWGLALEDGNVAHTACVGFGMDRLVIALFVHHGLDPRQWPKGVRALLQL